MISSLQLFTIKQKMKKTLFVIGGSDGESALIKILLSMAGRFVVQPRTQWGEHYYSPVDVGVEVRPTVASCSKFYYSATPLDEIVFVECYPAPGAWVQSPKLRVDIALVDHHAGDSWERASIMQILQDYCAVVEISSQLRRMIELVAANDVSYIGGMQALFASAEEIRSVRLADRLAQGVTKQQEASALARISEEGALRKVVTAGGTVGIIDGLPHNKFAPTSDEVYLSGGCDVLVSSCVVDGMREIQVEWCPPLANVLKDKFNGWSGHQYWGSSSGDLDHEEVVQFVIEWMAKN
jgi:hypothetical protein